MKTAAAILILSVAVANAGLFGNIHTDQVRSGTTPSRIVYADGQKYHTSVFSSYHFAKGWRILDAVAPIPEGEARATRDIQQDPARPAYYLDIITTYNVAEKAAAEAAAIHEATAPGADLSSWSKREKCLLLITFKLAKEHWPDMTQQQFLDNVKTEWDSVK